jgi:hypothetical protein
MGKRERLKRERRNAADREAEEASRAAAGESSGAEAAGTREISSPQSQAALDAETELRTKAGDHWASRPGGKGEAENARLVRMSKRWQTEANAETFDAADPKKLTAKDIAVLVTRRGMLSADARIVPIHVGNAIRMESQNQRDDLEFDPFTGGPAGQRVAAEDGGTTINAENVLFYCPDNGRSQRPVTIHPAPGTNGHHANGNGHAHG